MKKWLSMALVCVLMLSVLCMGASAQEAKTVVDGIRWFPCEPGRENDAIWEVECLREGAGCQGFLENETTTGNKNFLDTVYGADGSLTVTRNGNDGEELYWPRVRTLMLENYPELDLKKANTLYFDVEAINANWNIMLGINGMTVKLSKVIADACGVTGVANSDHDAPAGKFKGSVNLQDALAEMAAEINTESSTFAQAIQNFKTTYVPQMSVFVVGNVGACVKLNSLYISTADDVNGDKCDYLDMGLIVGDEYYEQEGGTTPTDPTTAPTQSANSVSVREEWAGMKITLEADKDSYVAGETIKATLTAENISEATVENVRLEALIPEGYQLKEGTAATAGMTLKKGEKTSLNVELVPASSPTEPSTTPTATPTVPTTTPTVPTTAPTAPTAAPTAPTTAPTTGAMSDPTAAPTATTTVPNTTDAPKDVPKDVPKTGDTSNTLLAIVLAAGAVAVVFASMKTRGGKQMLSVALCLTLCLGTVAVVAPAMANADGNYGSKTLSLTVKVDGKDLVLNGKVSYGDEPVVTTVTSEDGAVSCTIESPKMPKEFILYDNAGEVREKFNLTDVTYKIEKYSGGYILVALFDIEKTFDVRGNDYASSMELDYRVTSEGNVKADFHFYSFTDLKTGEKMTDYEERFCDLNIDALEVENGATYQISYAATDANKPVDNEPTVDENGVWTVKSDDGAISCKIESPTMPVSLQHVDDNYSTLARYTIKDVSYGLNNGRLVIYFDVEKTYDREGSGFGRSCPISYRLYDSEGYIVHSGQHDTDSMREDDKVRGSEEKTYYEIANGETYRIEFISVKGESLF